MSRHSGGDEARNRAYADLLKQGYEWKTNCSEGDVKGYRENYESQGLEVVVHNEAFTRDGTPYAGGKAILTRKR